MCVCVFYLSIRPGHKLKSSKPESTVVGQCNKNATSLLLQSGNNKWVSFWRYCGKVWWWKDPVLWNIIKNDDFPQPCKLFQNKFKPQSLTAWRSGHIPHFTLSSMTGDKVNKRPLRLYFADNQSGDSFNTHLAVCQWWWQKAQWWWQKAQWWWQKAQWLQFVKYDTVWLQQLHTSLSASLIYHLLAAL